MNKIRRFNWLGQLLNEYGYYEGAKILINKDETFGLTELILVDRKEISIEFLVLSEKYESLFTQKELEKCRRKLFFPDNT